jgi:hypothetical protein
MLLIASYNILKLYCNLIFTHHNNFFLSFYILDKCSSSVSHLVENELPLASVNIATTSTFEKRTRSSTGSQDINEIEVASEHENQNQMVNGTATASEFMYYQHENPSDGEAEKKKKAVNASQNVYSNIPSSPSSSVPNILKNAASDHVYSNIDETVTVNGGGNANVRFLSDNSDLDLDDPLLTSSFIKKKEIPNNNNQQNIYTSNSSSSHGVPNVGEASQSSKMILPSISSSSSTNGTQVTSIELKNVLSAVALQKNNNNNSSKQEQASMPMGPALHRQETMIDTALDLDSLDGSQVGLMKAL